MYKGIGLRPPYYQDVLRDKPAVDFFEVISENYMDTGGRPLHILEKVREDYPIAFHGVSLNIGSYDPINENYLLKLKALIHRIKPIIVSDHLCWTGAHSRNWHDLLPLPMTIESARNTIIKVKKVQDILGRRIALENISTYLRFKNDEISEVDFIRSVAKDTDCLILLDVNNVYVNSVNHGFDPYEYIRKIPADRVVQYHMGGHTKFENFLFDTHDAPIIEPVWDLFRYTIKTIGPRPFLIERDDNIPPLNELLEEANRASKIVNEIISNKRGGLRYAQEAAKYVR